MERWAGRVVLVTGASAGIGYAIAETLAKNGMHVIGCARRSEKIEELAKSFKSGNGKGKITAVKSDLTNEKDILAMFEKIQKEFKHVDVLINNAGVGLPDDLLTGQTEKWRQMLELNVLGLSICTREALRLMKDAGIDDGHIININSMLGHRDVPMAFVHFYGSTKHMTVALTKALNAELRQQKSHIRVTSISPGLVESEFMAVRMANSDKEMADQLKSFSTFNQAATLKSQDIADSVLYILGTPPHVNIRELQITATEYA